VFKPTQPSVSSRTLPPSSLSVAASKRRTSRLSSLCESETKKKQYVELDFAFCALKQQLTLCLSSNSLTQNSQPTWLPCSRPPSCTASTARMWVFRPSCELDPRYSDADASFCRSSSRRATRSSLESRPTSPTEPPNATLCVRSSLFLRVAGRNSEADLSNSLYRLAPKSPSSKLLSSNFKLTSALSKPDDFKTAHSPRK
jgi:hypothetical protein